VVAGIFRPFHERTVTEDLSPPPTQIS